MFVLTALVYPFVLALLCLGAGLLVDRLTGGRLPGMLLVVVGAATLICVSQLTTYIAFMAPATPYALGIVALAGLVVGRARVQTFAREWPGGKGHRQTPLAAADEHDQAASHRERIKRERPGERHEWGWQLAVGPLAYVIALAPVLAAGRPTFTSFQALTDSAVHMLGADYLMRHGQEYAHLDLRNSYGEYVHAYYGTSYPSGADTLFGGSAFILGLPLIWAMQPFAAFMLAIATGPAWVLARRMGLAGGWAALATLTATVPALVYGYELVASIKEIVALPMILALGALVVEHDRWLGQPAGHTRHAGRAKPAGRAGPAGLAESAVHAEPTGRAGPAGHVGPTEPAEPTRHAEPTGPAESAVHAEPTGRAGPAGHFGPTEPAEPTRHAEPTGRAGPAGLAESAVHAEPTGRAGPAGHVGPTEPAEPTRHAEPTGPAGPLVRAKSAMGIAPVIVPAIAFAAGVAALGVGFGAWGLAAAVVLGWVTIREVVNGRHSAGWLVALVALAAGAALVGALSTWGDLGGSLQVAKAIATTGNPGNLQTPLRPVQALGTWLSGSYQTAPSGGLSALTYAIAALTLIAAVLGAVRIMLLREYALGAWIALVVVAGIVLIVYSTTWVSAKTLMLTSPVLVLLAWSGIEGLRAARQTAVDERHGSIRLSRLSTRRSADRPPRPPTVRPERGSPPQKNPVRPDRAAHALWRATPIAVAAIIAAGIGVSDAMQYHASNLAPTARYEELASINSRFAGRGPALFLGFDEYALYVLRDLDISGLKFSYPPAGLQLTGGRSSSSTGAGHGSPVDLDWVPPAAFSPYPLIVTRRDPSVSEPPSAYRLAWQGNYYQVWARRPGAPAAIAHLGLDGTRVVQCSAVAGLARTAELAARASVTETGTSTTLGAGAGPGAGSTAGASGETDTRSTAGASVGTDTRSATGASDETDTESTTGASLPTATPTTRTPEVRLVAARPPELVMVNVAGSRHPSWTYTHPGLEMTRAGKMTSVFALPHPGVWELWLKGELMPSVTVSVDGRTLARVGGELDGNPHNPGTMAPLRVRLSAGPHRLTIARGGSNLAPGDGGWAILHEAFLTPAGADTDTLTTVAPAQWRELCGGRYDWIEATRE